MNKQTIIGILVFLVLVAVGVWYFTSGPSVTPEVEENNNQTATTTTSGTQNSTGATSGATRGTGTLSAAITRGGNYTCSVNTNRDGITTKGTVYVEGTKTRVNLRIEPTTGAPVETHVIRTGGWAYTWTEGQTTGSKTRVTTTSAIVPQAQGAGSIVDEGATFDWECRAWIPDQEEFTPPTQITFTEA